MDAKATSLPSLGLAATWPHLGNQVSCQPPAAGTECHPGREHCRKWGARAESSDGRTGRALKPGRACADPGPLTRHHTEHLSCWTTPSWGARPSH